MKYLKALYGLVLMLLRLRTLQYDLLKGKRVAIVGPAPSATGTGLGDYIDKFDVVIRLNKAPYQLIKGMYKEDIGTKFDILMHSYLENELSGGGKLDFSLYEQLGIQYVVNPIPTKFGKRLIFNFYKKYIKPSKTYIVPSGEFKRMVERFGQYRPTTGFGALFFLLNSPLQELYITGFTFFKTATYAAGYRDHLMDSKANDDHIKQTKQHDPDLEYTVFTELLREKHNLERVIVDAELARILAADGIMAKTLANEESNAKG